MLTAIGRVEWMHIPKVRDRAGFWDKFNPSLVPP